jgi:hypothetical protein
MFDIVASRSSRVRTQRLGLNPTAFNALNGTKPDN